MKSKSRLVFFKTALLLGAPLTAHAATYCVSSKTELNNALLAASQNAEDNTIKVQTGTYTGEFSYLRFFGDYSLDIEGGWDSGCSAQTKKASLTSLDGASVNHGLYITMPIGSTGNIAVRYLTFVHGLDVNSFAPALGISADAGDQRIENCVFRLNSANADTPIAFMGTTTGSIYFLDNGIADNSAPQATAILQFTGFDASTSGTVYFNNNTVADNSFKSDPQSGAVVLRGNLNVSMANNILWHNGGNSEIYMCCSAMPTLLNNDIDVLSISPDSVASGGNIMADPLFYGAHAHHVRDTSPVINRGNNLPAGTIRTIDLDGNPRIQFGHVDMGSYEVQDLIFATGLEPPPQIWTF